MIIKKTNAATILTALCVIGMSLGALAHTNLSHHLLTAPNVVGTGSGATVGTTTTGYPIGAPNTSDIWGGNGPTTIKTANLMGLVANTPVNVIPAVSGKQIVVLGYDLASNVAGSTVVFQDETAVTPLVFDGYTFPANGFVVVPRTQFPCIVTSAGAALDIAITGTSDVVKGSITYYYQ